jgi:hypothetical protein
MIGKIDDKNRLKYFAYMVEFMPTMFVDTDSSVLVEKLKVWAVLRENIVRALVPLFYILFIGCSL